MPAGAIGATWAAGSWQWWAADSWGLSASPEAQDAWLADSEFFVATSEARFLVADASARFFVVDAVGRTVGVE